MKEDRKLSRRGSNEYEVKKEKRRRRNDWMVWDHQSKSTRTKMSIDDKSTIMKRVEMMMMMVVVGGGGGDECWWG